MSTSSLSQTDLSALVEVFSLLRRWRDETLEKDAVVVVSNPKELETDTAREVCNANGMDEK